MIDITEEANRKYKSETAYQKKPLPESIDTSALKNALNQCTRTMESVAKIYGTYRKWNYISRL